MHIVLLGDSIFDNKAYTGGGPDVITQLRAILPRGSRATLLALDGSTTLSVFRQLERVPHDASHLVLSVGGNDVLWKADIIQAPARSVADALRELAKLAREFERNYREAVKASLDLGRPLTLCTIYDGCFPDPGYQLLASAALVHFNEAILRVGAELGTDVIDLRFICSKPEDYANPIEPSSTGGAKIARAVRNAVSESQHGNSGMLIFTR
jgi:hypothetical protein